MTKKDGAVRVLVTSSVDGLHDTVAALKKKGLKVDNVMDAIGVVSGEIAEGKLAALREVPGVTVEREGTVQIAPPDSPIQ